MSENTIDPTGIHQALLLGWEQHVAENFGFACSSPERPAEPPHLIHHATDSHLITFGATSTGKGRSVLIPNLLHYRGTTVVIDLKNGELAHVTARRRREFGEVFIIDPFHLTDFPKARLNPFDIFSWAGCQLETDAEMLADVFSLGNKGVKDPFWDQNGTGLLAANIAHAATRPLEERSLAKLIDLLLSDDVVYNLAVLLDTVGKTMTRMAYREIAAFLQMPEITRGGVLATTASYLKTFHSETVLSTFGPSTMNLKEFIAGVPQTFYIVFPVDRLHSHRAILKLILAVLLKGIVSRRSRPQTRTLLLIDECGQLGAFPFLETFITLCRSFGCWAWPFFQDLSQLKAAYPNSWKTILNNCQVLQTFGFHNRDLAEQWSDYFDSPADDLRLLSGDEQVLMMPGMSELRSRKLDYLTDAMFAGQFDPNPLYQSGGMEIDRPSNPQEPERVAEPVTDSVPSRQPTSKRSSGSGSDGGLQVR